MMYELEDSFTDRLEARLARVYSSESTPFNLDFGSAILCKLQYHISYVL